jgi:hypothetical protein
VVGPSFELVSGWAARGVPLKVALRGIDRCFERYHRKGPRRRPLKIDFCDADVLDVFDEWRSALGLVGGDRALASRDLPEAAGGEADAASRRSTRSSLPAHLERVVLRLTSARARGTLGDAFDELIDRVAREMDAARADARGIRGEARHALIARLDALDAELLAQARAAMDDATRAGLEQEADEELAGFRGVMPPDAFVRAREAAVAHLVRERCGLPTIAFV